MTDTNQNEFNTPWTLQFDRDGTEDFGIICDAEGNDLVASHLPGTRIEERTLETGTFWLPEYKDDTPPTRVRQMRVMAAAPKLLEAAKRTLRQFELIMEMDGSQAFTKEDW